MFSAASRQLDSCGTPPREALGGGGLASLALRERELHGIREAMPAGRRGLPAGCISAVPAGCISAFALVIKQKKFTQQITSTYRFVLFPVGFPGGAPGVPWIPWGPFPEGSRKLEKVSEGRRRSEEVKSVEY